MYSILRNKAISKTTALRKEIPFLQFNVAFYKRRDQVFIWTYNDIAYETTFITE